MPSKGFGQHARENIIRKISGLNSIYSHIYYYFGTYLLHNCEILIFYLLISRGKKQNNKKVYLIVIPNLLNIRFAI